MGNKLQNKINYKNKDNVANSFNENDLLKYKKGNLISNHIITDTYVTFINSRNSTNPKSCNLNDSNKSKFEESNMSLIKIHKNNSIINEIEEKPYFKKNYSLINFFNKSIKKNSIELNNNSFQNENTEKNVIRYSTFKSNKSTSDSFTVEQPKINLNSFSKHEMNISPIKPNKNEKEKFLNKSFQTTINSISPYFKIDTNPSYNLPQTSRTENITSKKKLYINKDKNKKSNNTFSNTIFNLYDNNIITLFESSEIRGLFLKKVKPFEIIYDPIEKNIAKYKYEDNSIITGKIIEEKLNGPCIFKNSNNTIFKGYYINNIPNGFGIFKTENGIFIGNWIENDLNGIGKIIWNDTSFYQGEFLNHMKHGIGTYQWPDGTTYQGEFCYNKMNGYGIIYYNNGNIFEGEMCDDEINGFGHFIWKNGKNYFGYYKNGKKNGFGILVNCKKPFFAFVGFWDNGIIDGPVIKIKNKNVSYELFRKGIKEKNIKSGDICVKYLIGKNKKYYKIFEMNQNKVSLFFNQIAFID